MICGGDSIHLPRVKERTQQVFVEVIWQVNFLKLKKYSEVKW